MADFDLDSTIKNGIRNMQLHARHVIVSSTVNWELSAQFLINYPRLQSITWEEGSSRPKVIREPWRSATYVELNKVFKHSPNVGLIISQFAYRREAPRAAYAMRDMLAANIVEIGVEDSGDLSPSDNLQDLLIASTRIERVNFHFGLHNVIPCPFDPRRGRLPPIKRLTFPEVYSWDYNPESMSQIWDFSQLQDLTIAWHLLGNFLNAFYRRI
ncbi:hypothetical protein GLAREA_12031 [Glarea lozoyensis ATCC 20868]|uniref:Uncharacterized protein n=1 Tax=Glarea lozoyensis (strain ATCC 20868 / MF5171) TaxID=1116229 RepID=S3D4A3_GLAL2|nr:uncharacterized protein GLAREA_12031 [Glarea lozoyensis ATCC 20868]EPE31949.1 hypothetical protein GLAREA_12031 [Glarea lozoyensis ATCC 20868]